MEVLAKDTRNNTSKVLALIAASCFTESGQNSVSQFTGAFIATITETIHLIWPKLHLAEFHFQNKTGLLCYIVIHELKRLRRSFLSMRIITDRLFRLFVEGMPLVSFLFQSVLRFIEVL